MKVFAKHGCCDFWPIIKEANRMPESNRASFLKSRIPNCSSLPLCLDSLRWHECNNKRISVYQNSSKVRLGFACECGEKWEVGLTDIQAYCLHNPDMKKNIENLNSCQEFLEVFLNA